MAKAPPLVRLGKLIVAKSRPLIALLWITGLLGFLALPTLKRKNFFDENGLLTFSAEPGITRSKRVRGATDAFNHALRQELAEAAGARSPAEVLAPLLRSRLDSDLYEQALGVGSGEGGGEDERPCRSLHSIVRTGRGSGKESIVLVTPVALSAADGGEAAGGWRQEVEAAVMVLGVGFAVSAYVQDAPWLAKDLVWVVPDARCGVVESMEAWVNQYHGPDPAFGRAGVLQQALVLEAGTTRFGCVEVSVEGWDGLLPKLDLFQVAARSADASGLAAHLAGAEQSQRLLRHMQASPWTRPLVQLVGEGFSLEVLQLMQFTARQARSRPTGAHAAFKSHFVDALTLRTLSCPPQGPQRAMDGHAAAWALTRVVEMTVRSCNNLQEKLHHSYFAYLQPSANHFISIETYIPLPILLLVAMLLQAMRVVMALPEPCEGGDGARAWADAARLVGMLHVVSAAAAAALRVGLCRAPGALDRTVLHSTTPLEPAAAGHAGSSRFETILACAAAGTLLAGLLDQLLRVAVSWPRLDWRRAKVVMLVTVITLSAGYACLNWALTYVMLVLMLPLGLCSCPIQPPARSSPSPPPLLVTLRFSASQLALALLLVACAPPLLPMTLAIVQSGVAAVALDTAAPTSNEWRGWVCDTSLGAYGFWWAAFVPLWMACCCIALLSRGVETAAGAADRSSPPSHHLKLD